jgi:hypothetical protein
MLARRHLSSVTLLLALSLFAAPAEAQFRDLIDRVRSDLRDQKHAEAVRRGQEIFAFSSAMTPEQLLELRQVMAAAFYPAQAEGQQPDSAMVQLVELVRLDPEATNAPDLKWAGLDSLLELARSRTFSVAARYPDETILVGADGRGFVDVVATRPSRFRLRITSVAAGESVVHDSATAGKRGRLSFRAHDGARPLIGTGEYRFAIVAVDSATGDSIVVRHRGMATGQVPALAPVAPFREASLRPETVSPPRARTVATGILFAGLTYAFATQARSGEPLRSAYPTDSRAMLLSGVVLAATVSTFWLDKGEPDREAMQANLRARDEHRLKMAEAEVENRRRIAAYRVTIRVTPESR